VSVPNCAEAGVLGVLPGIIGTIQATEAIKLILGVGESLVGRLLHFDALKMMLREFKVRPDPSCPVCGNSPTITAPIDYDQFCSVSAGLDEPISTISVRDLKQRLASNGSLVIVDVREPFEYEIAHIENSKLIPLAELAARLDELDRTEETVAVCHTGARSAHAVQLLQRAGFRQASNLKGGISAWANEIDPTMPKY